MGIAERVLEFVGDNVRVLLLFAPLGIVLWEGLFLHMSGSKRHWRRFGLAVYVGGFSLVMGGLHQLGEIEWKRTVATVFILFIIGGILPLVALFVREEQDGRLVYPRGPSIARFLGVATYVFCVMIVLGTPAE